MEGQREKKSEQVRVRTGPKKWQGGSDQIRFRVGQGDHGGVWVGYVEGKEEWRKKWKVPNIEVDQQNERP